MEIITAKSASFCFGVQNAIDKALEASNGDRRVYTYGPIIHNKRVVNELENKGIKVIENISDIQVGDIVIIRSHGISKNEYDEILERGAEIIDATCTNVKHIHKIVEEKQNEGYKIIIIGDPEHPEVKGVNGWCNDESIIINSEEDIEKVSENNKKICVVAQTTYNQEKWHAITCSLLHYAEESLIFNTICSTTKVRQNETLELSKNVELMIVVGGKDSSNTKKLYEIAKENCSETLLIQDADELDLSLINGVKRIGITGGASTPEYVIQEIVDKINSLEVNFKNSSSNKKDFRSEEANEDCYYMDFKDIYPGSIIKGEVILINNRELFLDIKYKSEAILTIEEDISGITSFKEKYDLGDIIDVEVLKMNNGEGNVLVSRKKLQEEEYLKKLYEIKDNRKEIEIIVDELNKGGYTCRYESIRAFMPLSLSGLFRSDDNTSIIGKRLKVLINEIKEKKNGFELVVSRKEIVQMDRDRKVKEQIENIEEGQILRGCIKSMINTGAFVNVENIDVFVPISEIVWRRINSPKEVLSEGNIVEVLVLKVDKDSKKVLGSIKGAGIQPWERFVSTYKEGDVVEGTVVRFAEYGAFIEIIDGVDGLLHISNMSEQRINKPQDVVKLGEKINTRIIKIDNELKRVGLSLILNEENGDIFNS